jgi:3-hydroxyisobutyrate dehydrogenase-like beta-hydroxyacid dehydrogenase
VSGDGRIENVATPPTIGFVGLGTMGGQMARRLAEQGYRVTGYDVDGDRAGQAEKSGVGLAKSPAAAAQAAEMVLSSLPDPASLRRAYLGPDGVLSTTRPGMTLIDLSTVDPDTWREVAAGARAKGADCLDAPVSGGPAEAGSGKLVFLVGGEAAVLERCRALLLTLGTEIHHVGPLGSGQIVKIVNNVMSMGNVAVAAEAMVLGVKAGMDPQRLFDILSTSGGRSHHFLKRFPNVLAGDFTPYFGIGLSRKDVSLALAMAAKLEMPMLVTSTVRQVYEAAHAQGFGQLDMAAVTKLYEHWTGVTVRAAAARDGAR